MKYTPSSHRVCPEEESEEESGKDWDELEEEAKKGLSPEKTAIKNNNNNN